MVKIESHCHSYHSFDCNTSIMSIIDGCHKRQIDGIVICDHDVCDITDEEEELFRRNHIILYKAIEFTTKTDAHVIGVSPRIKELQKPRFYYSLRDLIEKLKYINATIIIPHPEHVTGIVGNGQINKEEIDNAFEAARFVEIENYRYGASNIDYSVKYPQLINLIGSDAHSANSVGAFVNLVDDNKGDFFSTLSTGRVEHLRNSQHGKLYWYKKTIQKTKAYQWLLKLFSPELRRFIKNAFLNK